MPQPSFSVDAYLHAWQTKDIGRILAMRRDDSAFEMPMLAGPTSKEDFRTYLDAEVPILSGLTLEPKEVVTSGRTTACLLHVRATYAGDMEYPSGIHLDLAGKSWETDLAVFLDVDETGLIAREQWVLDLASVLHQLGIPVATMARVVNERPIAHPP